MSTVSPDGPALRSDGQHADPGPDRSGGARALPDRVRWRARRPPRVGLRSRLTALTAVAVGIAVALAALTAYLVLRQQLFSQFDASLLSSARTTAQAADPGTMARLASLTSGTDQVQLAVVQRSAPAPAAGAPSQLVGPVEEQVVTGRATWTLRSGTVDGGDYRIAAVPAQSGLTLVLARSLTGTEETLARFAIVLVLIGLGGVVLAGTAGYSVARAGLRPVTELTDAAEEVARTARLEPIVVAAARRDDEVTRLAAAFNRMLLALAESRDRERRLVADAGHELRTPLTSMRTNLDLLAQADRLLAEQETGPDAPPVPVLPPAERAEMLADLHAQAGELSGLVDDLVQLSRDEQRQSADVEVDLGEIVERATDRVRRRAPGVTFAAAVEPWHLRGNPALLERAVVNVLDNAAKWSPPGATVAVELGGGVVRVTDAGPGIAPEDLPRVFDRFFRADAARSTPGTGLGLSIVRQVVEQHGGSVRAERAPGGGARFLLVLPGVPGTS